MGKKTVSYGNHGASIPDSVEGEILDRIRTGRYAPGMMIPSERTLIEELNVSRLALREALSRLRALGVLEIRHGRGATVRPMDAGVLARLFPLMVSLQGEQTFRHVFEVRLALELHTVTLAAARRSQEDLEALERLVEEFRANVSDPEKAVEVDLRFHVQIARSTGNPLFTLLLQSFSGFVHFVQQLSCEGRPGSREAALAAHVEIATAIRERDEKCAFAAMESHLRISAERILGSGLLRPDSKALTAL